MFARALRRLYLPSFFTWCASCPGVAGGEREFSRDEDGEEDVGDYEKKRGRKRGRNGVHALGSAQEIRTEG